MNWLARLLLAAPLIWQVALKGLEQVQPLMKLLLVLLPPVPMLPARPCRQHWRPERGQLQGWMRHSGSWKRWLLVAGRRSRAPRQWPAPCAPAAAAALALLLPLHPLPQPLLSWVLQLLLPPPLLVFQRCLQGALLMRQAAK